MKSIKKQIISIIVISVAIISLVECLVMFSTSKKMLSLRLNNEVNMTVDSKTDQMNEPIKNIQFSVDELSAILIQMLDDTDKFTKDRVYQEEYQNKVQPVVMSFAEKTFGAMSFYLRFNPAYSPGTSGLFYADTNNDGKFEKQEPTDFSKYKSDDLEHVGWYYIPINNKASTWLDPYYNANIKVNMVSYVVPLYKDGKTIGIIGMDINFDKFKEIISNTSVANDSYSFLLNKDNNFLVHEKFEFTDKLDAVDKSQYTDISNQIKKQKKDTIEAKFDGEDRIIAYNRLINGWTVVVAPAKNNIFSDVNKLIKMSVGVFVSGLIFCILIAAIFSNYIVRAILKIKDFAIKLANYDFSSDIEINRKDEIGQTVIALNSAQNNVKELIRQIMEQSRLMTVSSDKLSVTVEELTAKAENIEKAVSDITNDIQETSSTSEEISASIEEVDGSINTLSSKAMEGSNNATQSKDRAIEVQNKGKLSIEEIRTLYDEKRTKGLKAIEDGKIVENIKVMADTIASISEQTNLLALNAAIEAARAGEHGKGFAIVADEVRKLAEQSSQAVASIQDTIVKVQESFKNLSDNSKDILIFIRDNVDPQLETVKKVGDQYYNDASFVADMSNEIAAMTEELTAIINQVNNAVQNTAEITQSSAGNAETIKYSIEETTRDIEQLSITAQDQAQLAQKLNEMIQRFKI